MTHAEDIKRIRLTSLILDANEQIEAALQDAYWLVTVYTPIAFDAAGGLLVLTETRFRWVSAEAVRANAYPVAIHC